MTYAHTDEEQYFSLGAKGQPLKLYINLGLNRHLDHARFECCLWNLYWQVYVLRETTPYSAGVCALYCISSQASVWPLCRYIFRSFPSVWTALLVFSSVRLRMNTHVIVVLLVLLVLLHSMLCLPGRCSCWTSQPLEPAIPESNLQYI